MMLCSFLLFSIPFVLTQIVLVRIKSYIMIVFFFILFGISIFALVKGGCTDPGIIPRQMGNNPECGRKREYILVSLKIKRMRALALDSPLVLQIIRRFKASTQLMEP